MYKIAKDCMSAYRVFHTVSPSISSEIHHTINTNIHAHIHNQHTHTHTHTHTHFQLHASPNVYLTSFRNILQSPLLLLHLRPLPEGGLGDAGRNEVSAGGTGGRTVTGMSRACLFKGTKGDMTRLHIFFGCGT